MSRRELTPLFAAAWLLCLLGLEGGGNQAQPPRDADAGADTAEAVAALQRVGGVFVFSEEPPGVPRELTFQFDAVGDDDLAHLARLGSLRVLDFNASTRLTDRGLAHVGRLTELRTLNIGGTQVTNDGLRHLRGLKKLETLQAWLTEIGDDGIVHLQQLPRLTMINLWDAQLTDAGVEQLAKIRSLKRICIGNSIDDRGVVLGEPAAGAVSSAAVAKLREALPEARVFYFDSRGDGGTDAAGDRKQVLDRTRRLAEAAELPEAPDLARRRRGHDWPRMLGPAGDGKSAETGLVRAGLVASWPPQGPPIVWQRPLGDSHGAPAVDKGRLVVFDRDGEEVRVACLHAETGERLWTFRSPTDYVDQVGYGDGPRCSPVIDDDRVYAYGADGMLYCLSLLDGAELWRVDTAAEFGVTQYFFGVGSTPVVEGNRLIVVVGGSSVPAGAGQVNLSKLKGNGTAVVAFDKRTGEVLYQAGDALASYASPKLATIDGRRWCLVFARGRLIGMHPETGQIDFEFPWQAKFSAAVSAATPVVVDDKVFISEAYGPGSCLLKVRPGGCEVVWQDDPRRRDKAMKLHWNTPVYHEGFLYGCSGRHASEGELRCVEWSTGRVMWSEPLRSRSSLLYVDGHLLSLGEYGQLLLFEASPDRCHVLRRLTLRQDPADPESPPLLKFPAWTAPVLARGLLYLRGKDRLVCLDLIPDR